MRIDRTVHEPLLHRRRFVSATAASLGAASLGGLGFAAGPGFARAFQVDSTPPAPPVSIAPDPVADLAASLDYDRDTMVAFVRDEIQYEAYAGILRGARGTLYARAGNAADQAVLLGALFDAAAIPHRFAIGQLAPGQAETLAANLTRTTDEANRAWRNASESAALRVLEEDAAPATPVANADDLIEQLTPQGEAAVALAGASTQTSREAIAAALAGAGIALPPIPAPALPETETSQHTWIQVSDGPTWIDYDPALTGDEPLSTPTETLTVPADEWNHQLRIVIAADEYLYGAVSRREVVSLATTSQRVVDVPIALSMASADELADLGATITQLVSGQKTIFPSIYADGVTVDASSPLVFATDAANASDPFGDATVGIADGETVAIWLVVEITSPGAAPIVIERNLLDRMTPEDRASGEFAPERIVPVAIVPTGIGDDTPDQLNALTIIHVNVARIPPAGEFARYARGDMFGALGLIGPALAGFRDSLGIDAEAAAGTWSYPSAPNVTAFHVTAPAEGSDAGPTTLTVDLLHRARTSLPLADAAPDPDLHPHVLSGVLDAIAERLLLAPETRGEAAGPSTYVTGPTVAGIFEAAIESDIEIRTVSTAAELDAIEADAGSRALMTSAVEAGNVVIVPVQPVELDGGPVLGWWIVDPATGRTTDLLQTGMAGGSITATGPMPVALFGNLPGYTFLTRAIAWVVANARALACLGAAILYGYIAVTVVLEVDPNNSGAVATGGLLGGGAAGAAGGLCLGP